MRLTLVALISLLAGGSAAGETISLFNGKNLSGWRAYLEDPNVSMDQVWSVRDGLLVCRGEPTGFLYTERDFQNFELVVEWRWAPGKEPGNSGVLMRINGPLKVIPRSYEAQLRSGDAGDLYAFHGLKMDGPPERTSRTPGHEVLGDFVGVKKVSANENAPGEWNTYRIRLAGDRVTVWVNGKQLNEAWGLEPIAGPIGLQSEGGEIHFRKVELTTLD
ncbi:MAG: hypothetical protein Kow00109_16430 [Acidobacteriota bacterium]